MALNFSRMEARIQQGEFIPLTEQNTSLWDTDLINYATHLLSKAQKLKQIGRFQIEAAIQSVHAHRPDTGVTDWHAVVQLYSALMKLYPTIGSAVAHAAAVGEAFGPEQGIALLDRIDVKRSQSFQPAVVTRAHLLSEIDPAAACALYQRAIDLTTEPPLRRFLVRTRDALNS